MKKLILTLAMVMMVLAASANSVRYFTRSQANRVARTLDAQNELMIYCGYEYELATYVIVNEVWAERVNSKYYEIWLYGYDAYTGEEIYMPVDLACIWLYNSYGNRMYSAAQYLRFRSTVATPNFYWTMPPYNPFVRHFHDPHFNHCYTYHYEIHRYGWRPPMPPPHGGPWAYHPYYMRTPHTPAPVPPKPFTPGVNYPQTPDGHGYLGGSSRNNTGTRSTAFNNAGGARTGDNMNNAGNPGTTNRNSNANAQPSGNRGAAVSGNSSNNRGNTTNTGSTNSRNSSSTTNTGTSNRGTSTTTNTGNNSRGNNATTNTGTSSRGTSAGTNTGSRSSNATPTTNTSSRSNSVTPAPNNSSRSSNAKPAANTSSRSSNATPATNTGSRNSSSTTNTGTSSRGSSNNSGTSGSRNSGTTNRGSNPTR